MNLAADRIMPGGVVAIPALLWRLHPDLADRRERLARLEVLFEGIAERRETP